jgi:hypothetical protein
VFDVQFREVERAQDTSSQLESVVDRRHALALRLESMLLPPEVQILEPRVSRRPSVTSRSDSILAAASCREATRHNALALGAGLYPPEYLARKAATSRICFFVSTFRNGGIWVG